MDLAEIERVIRVGMCAEKRMAECGCEWCSQRLAAIEAVRALHDRAEHAGAEVERARGMLAARGVRVATLEEVADRWVRERDKARAEVERLRAAALVDAELHQSDVAHATGWVELGMQRELDALRAQVETLTRVRDEAVRLENEHVRGIIATLHESEAEVETLRAALGPHATGDLVADVRRVVQLADSWRLSADAHRARVIAGVLRAAEGVAQCNVVSANDCGCVGALDLAAEEWIAAGRPGAEADLSSEEVGDG